jgi:TonB family protein
MRPWTGTEKENARLTLTWIRLFPLVLLFAHPSTTQTTAASPAACGDSICLSEILIRTPQPYDAAQVATAQRKADTALEALGHGANFGDVAKKVSDGPSAAYGGALGRFKRGQLAKEIDDKVFAMKVGEVSDVVRTKQGFTILQVTECGGVLPRSSGSIDVLSDTRGVDFGPYLQQVRQEIQTNWYHQIPESALTKKGKVIIEFSIMKDGSVANMRFAQTSGDVSLDRAAWGGVTKASPFPPLTSEFAGPQLTLRLRLYYNFLDKNELE